MEELIQIPNKTEFTTRLGDLDGRGASTDVHYGGKSITEAVTNFNFSKWDDEVFININNPNFERLKTHTYDFKNGLITLTQGDIKHETWVLNQRVLEYKVGYSSKPASNIISLDVLCSPSLGWHYQPALTQEQIKAGYNRPDNVDGSYAVYHNRRNNKYRVGKSFHAYRWEVTDSKGKKAWCFLTYQDGKLYIEMPGTFLENAIYPIFAMGAGDTFGSESAGASDVSMVNQIRGIKDTPGGGAGTTTNISVSMKESTTNNAHIAKAGLYKDSDDTFIGSGSADLNDATTTKAWVDFPVSDSIPDELLAITAWGKTGTGDLRLFLDADGAEGVREPETFGVWPSPISWGSDPSGSLYSLHCDYTPGAGGLTIPVAHYYRQSQ